ncbi:LysR family transcriptional regulator [Acidisoma sp. L85]|uniref:LysR family transcriptional regulator n=1 Tax=Acidisoma sp. L85 TaxID=1641850 RepID=UPI00131E1FAC|nr:LysR family transcriptional regulator [Acidisoma sp. L85]
MIAKPSLDDLAAFAALARTGSFTRTAAAMGMSPSNLSHTIRRLESRLGQRLLQRTSRSVSTTPAGEALLAELGPSLDSIGEALATLERGADMVAGTLRITATRQAHDAVIRPVLPSFLADYPEAIVEVMVDYAFRDIVADRFDAGIRLGEKIERDMIALKVGPDLSMAVVASPDYLAARPPIAHPRDLTGHRCINYRMTGSGATYAWEFERGEEDLTVQVSGGVVTNEPGIMLEAALDGLGIAYLLEHEAVRFVREGRLVRLLADWTPPFPGFHLYHPSRRQMRPVLTAFLDALKRARRGR